MKAWRRVLPLDSAAGSFHDEVWEQYEGDRIVARHPVRVKVGKPLDVVALKSASIQEIREYSEFLSRTAAALYRDDNIRKIAQCPCCWRDTADARREVEIFGIAYHRCVQCGHAFVLRQPTEAALHSVFAKSEKHSAAYTDKSAAQARIEMVVAPKIDWMIEVFTAQYGRKPRAVGDVGAGGGHFIAGLARAGITGTGFEVSHASRRFAKEVFGLALDDANFVDLAPQPGRFDALTLWGLLEYVPAPREMLGAARGWLTDGGMLVVEVPRYESLGTAVQAASPQRIARHLDPTSHLNCFSDASIVTALTESGFHPIAAWYFGMDAYELLVQLSLELGDDAAFSRVAPLVLSLQSSLDRKLLCDDIVIAAVPA
jgi:2-polyprenyl-3-methyl-5-hydroxy-6-metoxy-1,4-benzoquinol methylase